MGKNVTLSDEAYAALAKHKRANESFSDVIKRLASPLIGTFGDLERYVHNLDGPLFANMEALRRVKARKARSNAD